MEGLQSLRIEDARPFHSRPRKHSHLCMALSQDWLSGFMLARRWDKEMKTMMSIIQIKPENIECCPNCEAEFTLSTDIEKYCDKCKTHIVIFQDEAYLATGF